MNVKFVQQCNEVRNDADLKILRHIGGSRFDRAGCEFSNPNTGTTEVQLSEVYTFETAEVRDAYEKIIQDAVDKHALRNISLRTSEESGNVFPYSLEIIAESNGTLIEANAALANCFSKAAAPLPGRKGQSWQEYLADYNTPKRMYFKNPADDQIKKIEAMSTLLDGVDIAVVGSHRSKGIDLPVTQFEFPRNYTLVTFRNNFHDICVSVDAKFPIEDRRGFSSMFNTQTTDGFFEGFPEGLSHTSYSRDPQKFSLVVNNYGDLMTILNEIAQQDRAHKPLPAAQLAPAV